MRYAFYYRFFGLLLLGVVLAVGVGARAVEADGPVVVTKQLSSWLEGSSPLVPTKGTAGMGDNSNWQPYFVPGQLVEGDKVIGQPYYLAYANQNQPVQSTDWWSGVGMQWKGWVDGVDPLNPVIRTKAFISEPYSYQFMDLPESKTIPGLGLPVQGLRMWNATNPRVYTGSPDTSGNLVGWGGIADEASALLTVGLKGVHPISDTTPTVPQQAPWTNVRIQSYSDWGVQMSYATGNNELGITMANGSPFTWFQRTKGEAPFRVWAGVDRSDEQGSLKVWFNDAGVLGLTVANEYVAPGPEVLPRLVSTAAYAVFADKGNWKQQSPDDEKVQAGLFTNNDATRLVVVALPHNINLSNDNELKAALAFFQPYAWQRITNTQIHFPPVEGSQRSVKVNGKNRPLGYDDSTSTLRSMNAVTTEYFKGGGGTAGDTLQMVFPHQYKTMVPQDYANIPMVNSKPRYVWNTLKGPVYAYVGNRYVRELRTLGIIPYLPSVAVNSTTKVNDKLPVDDIYNSMKEWFYQGEPIPSGSGRLPPFVRETQDYWGAMGNTYSPNVAGLFESIYIADQMARSSTLVGKDTDRGKNKTAVAAEMRNEMIEGLKEILARWQDIYTVGWFQYNPQYSTIYGFPEGYGSVQNLNDKHFHWGYFLRSAAVVGRYDSEWLKAYLPLYEQMILDVARYARSGNRYPFLRNFSPFYGHSWANGLGNGGIGNDQESTSEALHFAAALVEIGQETGNTEWRDIGLWLYEEEINAIEQYWLNQDANLDASSGTYYNGNWPDALVRFTLNGNQHITPWLGVVFQSFIGRPTHFGSGGGRSTSTR